MPEAADGRRAPGFSPDIPLTLNETAAEIWKACDGSRTTREIARVLADRYEVEVEVCVQDTVEIVRFLESARLVTIF